MSKIEQTVVIDTTNFPTEEIKYMIFDLIDKGFNVSYDDKTKQLKGLK